MNLVKHVFYSWALAIVITLAGLVLYGLFSNDLYVPGHLFSGETFILFFGAYLVASPSLFISYLFLRFICVTKYTVYDKLALWYIATIVAVILNTVLIPLIVAPEIIEPDMFIITWPAHAGLVLSLAIRHKYFIQLFTIQTVGEEFNGE